MPDVEWTVPLTVEHATDAADRLTELLGRKVRMPLFISFMPLRPEDPPLRRL